VKSYLVALVVLTADNICAWLAFEDAGISSIFIWHASHVLRRRIAGVLRRRIKPVRNRNIGNFLDSPRPPPSPPSLTTKLNPARLKFRRSSVAWRGTLLGVIRLNSLRPISTSAKHTASLLGVQDSQRNAPLNFCLVCSSHRHTLLVPPVYTMPRLLADRWARIRYIE
jgi:hypothetical protein